MAELITRDKKILMLKIAKKWLDPVKRCEDIFNVKTSRGDLIPFKCPEPQKEILRDGPLGKAKAIIDKGYKFQTVLNKGRQIGFSTLTAMEIILMAEDYPNTTLYYIADDMDQTKDFLDKVSQLAKTANRYPDELGGHKILNNQDMRKTHTKKINNTYITGMSGRNPSRGKNSVYVVWDEMAWCISVHKEQENIWDVVSHFINQGGCLRMQSTPRTKDDKFWKYYTNPGKYGIKSYYKPTIENWKVLDLKQPLYINLDNEDRILKNWEPLKENERERLINYYTNNSRFIVDLEKQEIKQKNVIIPYDWIKLEDLEKQRQDYEKFLQECLGVSVDEKYKVIQTEWIYRNITADDEMESREWSKNPFFMLIDIAQVKDITAITIVEKMEDDIIVERKLDSTQAKYNEQVELIWTHFLNFKPQSISIDNTGHGRVIGDLLEAKLRMNGYPIQILNRVTFTNPIKEVMAEGFKNLVQNDKYKFLNKTQLHAQSIRHVERVEKIVTATRVKGATQGVKYSGKMWGRDDFFWSKAQIVYFTQMLMPVPAAAVGKIKREIFNATDNENKLKKKSTNDIREELKQEQKIDLKSMARARNIGRAILELKQGIVDCPKTNKVEKPLLCTGCERKNCFNFDGINNTCVRHNIDRKDVWEKQRAYRQNFHGGEQNEGIRKETNTENSLR